MKEVDTSSNWSNDKTVIDNIYCVSNQIKTRLKRNIRKEEAVILEGNIKEVLHFWTSHTYIGQRKDAKLQKAFQQFFENLLAFSLLIKNRKANSSECGFVSDFMSCH